MVASWSSPTGVGNGSVRSGDYSQRVSELKSVYLLAGTDRPKIARALRRLRDHFDPQAVDSLSAHETSGSDACAACNSYALFGGGRLVIVTDVERWKAEDAKSVTAYASDPAPGAVLALVAGELRKDAALAKAVAKVGEVLQYDVVKRDLPRWVAEQFKRVDASADAAACRALVDLVGESLDELATEVEKLVAWAGGEKVTQPDVELLAAGRPETSIFALTDAWGRRDVAAALRACEQLLERGQGTRRDELPRIVGMLGAHVDRVRRCRSAAAEGLRPRDVASEWKRSPYYVEKLFAQAENFSADELRDAVVRLAELDHALKGGSRLAGDLELQRALVELTRGREALRSRAA
jgi:DNA polymerase III subunit delta